MSQHAITPLLVDTRLALPTFESSKIATGIAAMAARLGTGKAMGIGAAAGGLKGLLAPGTEYDDNGRPHQKSRAGAMFGGIATGAAAGGLAAPLIRGAGRTALANPGLMKGIGGTAPLAAATPAAKPGVLLPDISHLPGGQMPDAPGTGDALRKSALAHVLPSIGMGKKASLPGGLTPMMNQCAEGGAANANIVTHKEASKDKIVHGDAGGMKKGPAETLNNDATLNPAIDDKTKEKPKAGFPQLNLKKK